jgi:hypothetical protein
MEAAVKQTWLQRVQSVDELHRFKLRESNLAWRVQDTAQMLNRSYGSVAEDLMIASWLKSYPNIDKYKTLQEALEFIRAKKKEMKI